MSDDQRKQTRNSKRAPSQEQKAVLIQKIVNDAIARILPVTIAKELAGDIEDSGQFMNLRTQAQAGRGSFLGQRWL